MPSGIYETSVFVNCPFDEDYQPLMEAILFSVTFCGYELRSALETEDSSEVRVDKICRIIKDCRLGIHDLSRTELDQRAQLPRFNMPFELGLFLGAKKYGGPLQRRKSCLILDTDRYRYQSALSDISGQDIHKYDAARPVQLACRIRDWLKAQSAARTIPGTLAIQRKFHRYLADKPRICKKLDLKTTGDLSFSDLIDVARAWIDTNEDQ